MDDIKTKAEGDLVSIEDHINKVLGLSPPPPFVLEDIKDIKDEQYLDSVVRSLKYQGDKAQGLEWFIKGDSLIRKTIQPSPEINLKEVDDIARKGQFVNYARAALLYLNHNLNQINQGKINEINKFVAENLGNSISNKEELANYNAKIIEIIKGDTKPKDLEEKLKKALDVVSLRDDHYHYTTITDLGEKDKDLEKKDFAIETSVKLDGLTEDLKNQIKLVSGSEESEKLEYDQFLAKEAAKLVVESNFTKVIPTQFLSSKLMPGIKNAYMEVCFAKQGEGEAKEILRNFRSGIPVMKDDQSMTKEMIGALGEGFILNSLVTASNRIPFSSSFLGETKLFNTLEASAKDISGIKIVTTPVNIANFTQNRDLAAYQEILDKVEKAQAKATTASSNLEENKKAIQNFKDCKENLTKYNNYELSSRMAQLVHDVKRGPLNNLGIGNEIPEILTFCKSGKDRTGIRMLMGNAQAFNNFFSKDIVDRLIQSGHQQNLAGTNGGTPFCFGIKGEVNTNMPIKYRDKNFARDTASGNKPPVSDKYIDKNKERITPDMKDLYPDNQQTLIGDNPMSKQGSVSEKKPNKLNLDIKIENLLDRTRMYFLSNPADHWLRRVGKKEAQSIIEGWVFLVKQPINAILEGPRALYHLGMAVKNFNKKEERSRHLEASLVSTKDFVVGVTFCAITAFSSNVIGAVAVLIGIKGLALASLTASTPVGAGINASVGAVQEVAGLVVYDNMTTDLKKVIPNGLDKRCIEYIQDSNNNFFLRQGMYEKLQELRKTAGEQINKETLEQSSGVVKFFRQFINKIGEFIDPFFSAINAKSTIYQDRINDYKSEKLKEAGGQSPLLSKIKGHINAFKQSDGLKNPSQATKNPKNPSSPILPDASPPRTNLKNGKSGPTTI